MWPSSIPVIVMTASFVVLLPGCAQNEQKMPPEAALIDSLKEPVDRTTLAPHTLHLLEETEQGRLAGADSTKYAAELAKADEIQKGKQLTRYLFFLDDYREKGSGHEGHPVLYIQVQNKFGHIVQCGVTIPCW